MDMNKLRFNLNGHEQTKWGDALELTLLLDAALNPMTDQCSHWLNAAAAIVPESEDPYEEMDTSVSMVTVQE